MTPAQRETWRVKYHARQNRLHGDARCRVRGRKPSLAPSQATRLVALWGAGVRIQSIADELGCAESTIRRTAWKMGLPRRRSAAAPVLTYAPPLAMPWWER